MKKWWLPFLTLSFIYPLFGMTIDNLLQHKDITPLIINKLHKEDLMDMRLVCKKWAHRTIDGAVMPNWQLMPDTIEKRYDSLGKQKENPSTYYSNFISSPLHLFNKKIILFDLINDLNAVQWITDRDLGPHSFIIRSTFFSDQIILPLHVLAVQPKIARLLIEKNKDYTNQCWENVYDTTIVPKIIRECLLIDNDHDFTFIRYLVAIIVDSPQDLTSFYKTKKPTKLGKNLLIENCLYHGAKNCFKMLIEHRSIKKYFKQNRVRFFLMALSAKNKCCIDIILKKKLFKLEVILPGDQTILDCVVQQKYSEHSEENKEIIGLLKILGAKTYKEIYNEKRCMIPY